MNSFLFRIFNILLWILSTTTFAQDFEAAEATAEKIYLQLSAKTVSIDQTIWFKTIVTDAENHLPSSMSQVLHVELIDAREQIVKRKMIKLTGGIGCGHFELNRNFRPGRYLIRAYTQWNRNFGTDFVFSTYINIYDGSRVKSINSRTDLLPATKAVSNWGPDPKTSFQLNFFPESGKLLHGVKNKIGFKAEGVASLANNFSGVVFDANGEKVSTFSSNHLGMGFFYIHADSATTYRAEISTPFMAMPIAIVDLPEVSAKGSILSARKIGEEISLNVCSNTLEGTVLIKISCRGADYYLIKGQLEDGKMLTKMEASSLPEGIIVITLLDNNKMPVAERLYFNTSIKNRLLIDLNTDKALYKKRELLKLNIRHTNNTESILNSNISVMATNKAQWSGKWQESILSYFLLDSELRGRIEQPGYYFSGGKTAHRDLDALMLTQGWRNYKYPINHSANTFSNLERGITIKGRVVSNSPKSKPLTDLDLSLGVFTESPIYYKQQTDSLGRFRFLLDDIYGIQPRVLLQGNIKGNAYKNIRIILDTLQPPKVHFENNNISELIVSPALEEAVVAAQQRRSVFQTAADSLLGGIQLDEVVLEEYSLTSERERAYEDFGRPDAIIRGDSLQKQEQSWSYGIYSILLFEYPELIQIERFPDGFMRAQVNNDSTLIAVDGRLLRAYEYDYVQDISPAVIESVEIMQFVPFFRNKFLDVFPDADPYDAPTVGHIIAIFTKNKVGLGGTGKPIRGMLGTTIPVFSPAKEFYIPVYESIEELNEKKPDLRSLLYWLPNLPTNVKDETSLSFYNGDVPGDYIIIVEAISQDGKIGYKKIEYKIEE
ncbi:hypothetical protein [Muriicola sp. Z0-33]|uniref:hypothetical protein n=1 Tax=Muriicola sp. Z0-33 TaxID=2816957 RepID=UPI0022372B5A|nr:hypothetical protein [Muriicola sp. Z0-33]MCW5516695.1 hypothetical protein [Muriicola sp. Z0-33]